MVDFLSLVLRRTFLLPLIVLALLAPRVMAQADVQGQWGTASYQLPINPVHVALLHNGKVLIVTGSGNCPLLLRAVRRVRLMARLTIPERPFSIRLRPPSPNSQWRGTCSATAW